MTRLYRLPVGSMLLALIVAVMLFFAVGGTVRGAQAEADIIHEALASYLDAWNPAVAAGTEVPDSAETEQALVEIWNTTIAESACERFAGDALGVATLIGLFNDTQEPAYLEPALALMEQMDAAEYACLIEA